MLANFPGAPRLLLQTPSAAPAQETLLDDYRDEEDQKEKKYHSEKFEHVALAP